MNGYCAKHTARHVMEPLGYGLLRKVVRRKALPTNRVNAAADQYEIHTIAAEFRSTWIRIPPPCSLDSSYSYTMVEVEDCDALPDSVVTDLVCVLDTFDAEFSAFKCYMMREGYFARGCRFLRKRTTYTQGLPSSGPATEAPFYLVDFSLYGHIQEGLVRFPDLPWTYTIFQAELLFGG
jgi:hypothetical protein